MNRIVLANDSQSAENAELSSYYGFDRPEMLDYIGLDARRTLEVGCASGNFSVLVKKKTGAQTWGIELNPRAAELAAANVDVVKCGSIEDVIESLPANYFDYVIFNDVLEHLVDPSQILRSIRRTLTEGGSIVASIPNLRYVGALRQLLFERDLRYTDSGIFDRTHLRFFTKKSIRRTFDELDYAIERMDGLFPAKHERGRWWKLVHLLSFLNFFEDMQYLQFACVVKSKR